MSRSETKKILKYIKTGSVSKLRHFVRKHDVDLNKIRDSEERGVLHLASYLGDGRITRCLLRCGANPCTTDIHGNTPLHKALEYTLEFNNESAFIGLVLPLKKKSKRVMHLKNDQGDTPEELFVKLKGALRQDLSPHDEQVKVEDEELKDLNDKRKHWKDKGENQKEEEKEWLEKLAFESSCDDFYFKEESPLPEEKQETYNQWADRIRREFSSKRTSIRTKNDKTTKQQKEKQKEQNCYKELTEKLAKEHDEYLAKIRLKTKAARLGREREEYEQKCKDVFENESTGLLRFGDIPWPCSGSAVDVLEKLSEWSGGEETMKYLKTQRIRWHPDRFLQRCRHRLKGKDKDRILDLVKQISQGINALISSL